ncbi:hypothetical protein [Martelella sp. HB161492]|uniref:hypothetical protein n=1 Tax=Martelella sp. HB161492 TaxID=2720726 RepID=UPI0015902882|nr:hypothetical protein [Martelella sp. HB161492]
MQVVPNIRRTPEGDSPRSSTSDETNKVSPTADDASLRDIIPTRPAPHGNDRYGAQNDWRRNPDHRHLLRLGATDSDTFRGIALRYRDEYQVPARNIHSDGAQEVDYNKRDDWRTNPVERAAVEGMMKLMPTAKADTYAHLTSKDRLDITAHGSKQGPTSYSADRLAEKLAALGLREIGIIKLQSCHVGAADYPKKLCGALTARGIKVGYISAPKAYLMGAASNHRLVVNGALIPRIGDSRFKVVKGNLNVRFAGTRYT